MEPYGLLDEIRDEIKANWQQSDLRQSLRSPWWWAGMTAAFMVFLAITLAR